MRKHGFSLLEVLIAMTILSVGVFGAMKLFPMTLRQVRAAQERTVASQLAEDRFARLRTAGGRNLTYFPDTVFAGNSLFHIEKAEDLYAGYTTSVSAVSRAEEVWLKRASFSVKMPDGRYERFVTIVAEP